MQKKDPTKIVFSYLIVHKGQQYIIDTHKNNVVGMYLLHLSNASREKVVQNPFPPFVLCTRSIDTHQKIRILTR